MQRKAQRVWISKQAHDRLQRELATLRRRCLSAIDSGDEDRADDIHRWQSRIQEIHDLLVDVTVGQDPPDDGIAEPGMVLTIRYDDTGEVETFLLGLRGAEPGDLEVYSVHSPLGAALEGARPGERRTYAMPNGAQLTVTLLRAVPYGMHTGAA
ncbi:GreA/GreB family elongation factor [Mycobacterium asiaticum]|uniref:Transcription elongation factor GreAB n=1 Tax=Mycobacterium asiaticum TaxID=1790 RepID=A0A1A3NZA2_MYCAS|nr:GreA/GreB family elongation factor [Mycobacterium asiaticum]OBK27271.1 transcription elongation factor GreAB [Mycobacterium asiaticum]OBK94045.1 transcription elongation factor GreAB [Mycobacterium asiaticum]